MSLLETSEPDNLIASDSPAPRSRNLTVKSGQVLSRGQVAAFNTGTGHVVAYDSSVTGGHDAARFIMAEDVDASAGATIGEVYDAGCFNESALVFTTTGEMTEALRTQLADYGILTRASSTND